MNIIILLTYDQIGGINMETIINLIVATLILKSTKLLIKDFFYALLKEDVKLSYKGSYLLVIMLLLI